MYSPRSISNWISMSAYKFKYNMAPPLGLSAPRAPKYLFNNFKQIKKEKWSRNYNFLMNLHQILHARSCLHFQCFPRARCPLGPWKTLKAKIYFGAFVQHFFFIFVGEPLGGEGMVPWCHSEAIISRCMSMHTWRPHPLSKHVRQYASVAPTSH